MQGEHRGIARRRTEQGSCAPDGSVVGASGRDGLEEEHSQGHAGGAGRGSARGGKPAGRSRGRGGRKPGATGGNRGSRGGSVARGSRGRGRSGQAKSRGGDRHEAQITAVSEEPPTTGRPKRAARSTLERDQR